MEYIKSEDYKKGAESVAEAVINDLKAGKKVLWFATGGSSIPACVEIFNAIMHSGAPIGNLTVTITDERYGEIGHKDSNWQKLFKAGLSFGLAPYISPLRGTDINNTMDWYKAYIKDALETHDSVIACFGIGADAHIAGLLPESEGVKTEDDVVSYQGPDFMRISLGLNGIRKIKKAFVFVFGESKRQAIQSLKKGGINPIQEPMQVLHDIEEVVVYSDQI